MGCIGPGALHPHCSSQRYVRQRRNNDQSRRKNSGKSSAVPVARPCSGSGLSTHRGQESLMRRAELTDLAICSQLTTRWHFLNYHFEFYIRGETHPFVESLLDALLTIDALASGYAAEMIRRIAAIGGRPKDKADYAQLLRLFAEIHVVAQVAAIDWGNASIRIEPGADQVPNPEITVETSEWILAIEVKAPSWLRLRELREGVDTQLMTRFPDELGSTCRCRFGSCANHRRSVCSGLSNQSERQRSVLLQFKYSGLECQGRLRR